jgi:hypothetical protein
MDTALAVTFDHEIWLNVLFFHAPFQSSLYLSMVHHFFCDEERNVMRIIDPLSALLVITVINPASAHTPFCRSLVQGKAGMITESLSDDMQMHM